MSVKIREATGNDFEAIAVLAAKLNAEPVTQCIHSGEETEAIHRQMQIWHDSGELAYVVAEAENDAQDQLSTDRFIATIGGEFDEEMGRCWLWGPHSTQDNWEATAAQMFANLREVLPGTITIYDCYLNEQNQRGLDFYRGLGFEPRLQAHVYVAPRPEAVLPLVEAGELLTAVSVPSMASLHDTLFPNTYISGEKIWANVDEQHQVFVETRGEEVVGYIYAVVDDADETLGYIEYVGVAEKARGQGLGGKLLRTALFWLFVEKNVREVGLNVDDTNTNARGLYEKVGFQLKYSGVNLRLTTS
jgi:ribosomal protein S18 acetylase RimI-like enzyme